MIEWLYCWLRSADRLHDIDWRAEAEVAEELGFRCHGFDFEWLIQGRLDEALAEMPEGTGQTLSLIHI